MNTKTIVFIPAHEMDRLCWLAENCGTDASGRYSERITQNLQRSENANAEVIPFPERHGMTPKPAA